MITAELKASPGFYAGLFIISLCTVMFELLLTRIFSVTTWYHFAFLAISLAMLGMSVGAILVYLRPGVFTADKAGEQCAKSALLFAGTSLLAVLIHIKVPLLIDAGATTTIIISLLAAVPLLLAAFVCSGVCVSLALTQFPRQVNRLYAADLIGASIGGIAAVGVLFFCDGISAVFVASGMMALAAVFFAMPFKKLAATSAAVCLGLIALGVFNSCAPQPLITVSWSKGQLDDPVLWQKWNSFSRIRVMGDPNAEHLPTGFYGRSKVSPVRELLLDIDGCAQTTLTQYDGKAGSGEHLKYDIASIVHYLRPDSKVMVIGMGGGRDILAALAMGQPAVTGVEINPDIIKADCDVFGDFTGHLDKNARVKIVNQEGRNFVSHSNTQYDVITASVVDTWAASASGAFALSENSLYTSDCWVEFLNHLSPRGVLAMTRFYVTGQPGEFYRLTSLAVESLRRVGIADPRQHICAIKFPERGYAGNTKLATLLVSKSPLSQADIALLRATCEKLGYDVLLTPDSDQDPLLAKIATVTGKDRERLAAELPWNIAAPTDDSPFFFQMFKLSAMTDPRTAGGVHGAGPMIGAFLVLAAVLDGLFALGCFLVPLWKLKERSAVCDTSAVLGYFFMIGLGFMFIEVSQIQRFTIFLGHPTYGATVALTTLLLATGCGSFSLKEFLDRRNAVRALPAIVLGTLILFAVVAPPAIDAFRHTELFVRILITFLLLFPTGLVLGILFPFGMQIANARFRALTPWLWGLNGVASVLGSLLTIIVSILLGINASLVLGIAGYAAACGLFMLLLQGGAEKSFEGTKETLAVGG